MHFGNCQQKANSWWALPQLSSPDLCLVCFLAELDGPCCALYLAMLSGSRVNRPLVMFQRSDVRSL